MEVNCVSVKSERLDEPRPEDISLFCLNRSNMITERRTSASGLEFARSRLQAMYECKQALARKLLYLVQTNDFDQFKRLVDTKPDLNVLINGQTVLHYCLLFGRDVSWCKQLVSNGANPNLSNLDGWHPIHLAAFNAQQETLNYLLSLNQYHQF